MLFALIHDPGPMACTFALEYEGLQVYGTKNTNFGVFLSVITMSLSDDEAKVNLVIITFASRQTCA